MTPAERVAAALREVADMVEALDTDVQVSAYVRPWDGEVRVGIEPLHSCGRGSPAARQAMDRIAGWLGTPLFASHSSGSLWSVFTDWDTGRLPSGVGAYAHHLVAGRPVDLAPLPERRRRTGRAS